MSILKRAYLGGKVIISETLLQCPRCGNKDVGEERKCPVCGAEMKIQQTTTEDGKKDSQDKE